MIFTDENGDKWYSGPCGLNPKELYILKVPVKSELEKWIDSEKFKACFEMSAIEQAKAVFNKAIDVLGDGSYSSNTPWAIRKLKEFAGIKD